MRFRRVIYGWSTNFPDGPLGVGLLLARAVLGLLFMLQGRCYLTNGDTTGWSVGIGMFALGGLLAAGLLTGAVGIVGIVGGVLFACSVIPDCSSILSRSNYAVLLAGAMLVELVLAGPGAYSVDARLFGPREIIIPRVGSSDEP
jgi:uncharacterized membrane protein YphA (DoxX/SURF4 family)